MLLDQSSLSPPQRAAIADAARPLPPKLHTVFTRRVLARLTSRATDTDVALAIAAVRRESRFAKAPAA